MVAFSRQYIVDIGSHLAMFCSCNCAAFLDFWTPSHFAQNKFRATVHSTACPMHLGRKWKFGVSFGRHWSWTSAHWTFATFTNFYFYFRRIKSRFIEIFEVSSRICELRYAQFDYFDFCFRFLSFMTAKMHVIRVNLVWYYIMVF